MAREVIMSASDLDPEYAKKLILELANLATDVNGTDYDFCMEADFFGSDKKHETYRFSGYDDLKNLLDNPDEISVDGYESATIVAYHKKEKKDE